MKILVDITDETSIYKHINKMATDISELMGVCTCEDLPITVKRKCESIINVLYYLNDINGWMYNDNHWEIRSSDNFTTNITDEDRAWADIEIEKLEERLSNLENKQPAHVPLPVIGPTKQFCSKCGHYVDGNHICSSTPKLRFNGNQGYKGHQGRSEYRESENIND